jgi:hypothetical protein
MKNMGKWTSYRLAYGHIKAAMEQGFYIEALALEESIISDRLDSAVKGKGIENSGNTLLLGKLITLVNGHPEEFKSLHGWLAKKGLAFEDVRRWKDERNKFVHNVAHGLPEQETPVSAKEYDARGKVAATAGKKLAEAICGWSKSERRAAKVKR